MSRYQKLFETLKAKNEGAFVPFAVLGEPTLEDSFDVIDTMVQNGADALELGIPFSDPGADGPVIMTADRRALQNGANTPKCFEIVKRLRDKYPDLPIGLLMYINLVYAPGIENFFKMAADAGVDSVLIADVPVEMFESDGLPWKSAAESNGIDLIFIAPPNATDEALAKIAKYSRGYIYLVSRSGVTGAGNKAGHPIAHVVKFLGDHNAVPTLLGFGISTGEQVRDAIRNGTSGAITGSALVNIVEENLDNKAVMLEKIAQKVRELKAGTRGN